MSSPDDEDLEDGEIASDDDDPSDNVQEKKEIKEPEKKPDSAAAVGSSPKPSGKSVGHQSEENDFEKDLQKLKEDVERKKIRKDAKKRRENQRDNKRRKRKSLDGGGKNRKGKKRKVESGKVGDKTEEEEEEEDVDDDEMLGLCIRGASPTVNLEQIEVWSGKQPINDPNWQFNENSENESDEEIDDRKRRRREKDRRNFKGISREDKEIKKRLQMKRKGKNRKDMDSSDMICINFMKGNCNKGNDCFYSHAVCPPKKMELCKFYLMDCCAKRDKCLYLHEEFPCKFFHTGLKCYSGKKCKFSHDPLNSLSKDILLKHLETAPKEILGDFPRLSRDCAETMVNNKTTGGAKSGDTSKIPSLFDIQVSIPFEFQNTGDKTEERTTPPCSPPPNVKNSPKTKPKEGPKFYQDQDENERPSGSPMDFALELEAYKSHQSLAKNTDEGTDRDSNQGFKLEGRGENDEQFSRRSQRPMEESEEEDEPEEREGKRRKKKHDLKRSRKSKRKNDNGDEEDEDEDERDHRKGEEGRKSRKDRKSKKESQKSERPENNAVRLSEDGTFGGIKFKIINRKEIRKSSDSDRDVLLPMKIEKPHEFLSSDDDKPLNYFVKKGKREVVEDKPCDDGEKFGVEIKPDVDDETDENEPENPLIIETNDEPEEDEKPEEPVVPKHLPKKQRELFLRIQAQNQKVKDEEGRKINKNRERKTSTGSGSEEDAGNTPPPEPADEDWYSSDEDNPKKEETVENNESNTVNNGKTQSPDSTTKEYNSLSSQSYAPPTSKPKIDIPALNGPGLSKINITQLLSSIREVTNKKNSPDTSVKPMPVPPAASYEPPKIENPIKINFFNSQPEKKEVKDPRLRDPRINSESKVSSSSRRNSGDHPNAGKSIYDSANLKMDAHDSDLRFQSKFDSDERLKTLETIVPFGDVDLRNLGGQGEPGDCDFDMRKFGLPFKPVPIHSAATEIDASLNSHPPISYKVEAILIPRPDYSSLKLNPSDPQVKRDPRLRRLFRINSSEADPKEEQQKKSGLPSDPRQRKPAVVDTPKSPPTESPFSPKQNEAVMGGPNLLNANLLLLAQLGLSAAAAGTNVFDPRVQQLLNKTPQELEILRNHLSTLKTQSDFDLFRNQLINNENLDMIRPPGQALLPTPLAAPGMGLLGPAPGFIMPGINIPDPSVMMAPMAQLAQNPMGFDPRFTTNSNEDDMKDSDVRHFNRGFRNDRRGRGNWRGNRDRNWDRDNRRHNKRDDRDRSRHNRDRDDRKERKRSSTPD